MAAALISLSLHAEERELLDKIVEAEKVKSFTPDKVNRSTVIRELIKTYKFNG